MPRVRRSRTVGAPPEDVWALISDPSHLPRWWPGVRRVEDVHAGEWTSVLESRKGRTVRADYTRMRADRPTLYTWRQEIAETPFEGFLVEAESELSLEPTEDGRSTKVSIEARERLRGISTLGGLIARRAAAKRLEGALEGLDAIVGRPAER